MTFSSLAIQKRKSLKFLKQDFSQGSNRRRKQDFSQGSNIRRKARLLTWKRYKKNNDAKSTKVSLDGRELQLLFEMVCSSTGAEKSV